MKFHCFSIFPYISDSYKLRNLLKKLLLFILISLPLLAALIWFGGPLLLSTSVADYEGTVKTGGITGAVEITFDKKGIPQVWAATDKDMVYALGRLHASERLFQMELIRRMLQGRLSEVFGDRALSVDIFNRKAGFARLACEDMPNLSSKPAALLKAYCNGVNDWIKEKTFLPPEFVILGLTPEPWQPADCMGIALYQTWYSHSLGSKDNEYGLLAEKLGKKAEELLLKGQLWSPPVLPQPEQGLPVTPEQTLMTIASNSWAVAPGKSSTGMAMHASDPHLSTNSIPGFWYLAGLHSDEGTEITGVTVPGVPLVMMGHNGYASFAFTVASIDIVDHYRHPRNDADTLLVQSEKGLERLTVQRDSIIVDGHDTAVPLNIMHSSRGVIIESDSASVIAMHWAGYDFRPTQIMENGWKLQHVRNFFQFCKLVTGLGALDVNWVYSDRHGNIGYQLGTPIPVRRFKPTFGVLPGEDSTTLWQGYRSLAETPSLYNPAAGWLGSCNNRIVPEDWPYDLPGFYDPYRYPRLAEVMNKPGKKSPEEMQALQLDLTCGKAHLWIPLLTEAAKTIQREDIALEVKNWDGTMTGGSETAALFMLWNQQLDKLLFSDQFGKSYNAAGNLKPQALQGQLPELVDNINTADLTETPIDIAAQALDSVLATEERPELGDISKQWIKHPLGSVALLDYWLNLNRGPYPADGSGATLNANFSYYDQSRNLFVNHTGPSMRFLVDWTDINAFTINTNVGQSGNPFSPHYDDMIATMHNGERIVMPFARDAVFDNAASILVLEPESGQ